MRSRGVASASCSPRDERNAHSHIYSQRQHRRYEHGDAGVAEALVGLTAADDAPLDGFRIMCRSAASATAAAIARQEIEAHYHRTLTAALRGPDAPERAALVLAVVAGVQIMAVRAIFSHRSPTFTGRSSRTSCSCSGIREVPAERSPGQACSNRSRWNN